jgi:two-component system OmpR family sensor kinase
VTLALRTRLTVFYTAVFALLLTSMSVLAYRALASQLDADATAALTRLTNGLHGYLRFDGGVPSLEFDASDDEEAAFVHDATRYYQIYDANTGALLVQSEPLEPLGLRYTPTEVRAFRDRPDLQDVRTDYGRIRISNSLISAGPGQTYLLQVGASLETMDSALSRFLQLLSWSVPAALVVMVLAGSWMARVALAPLSRLAGAARTIGVTNLQQRLPVRGANDELDEVAQSFNDALGRLEKAVGEMRQFSTALAHELRTPLAALRGEIEMALLRQGSDESYRGALASQLEEIDRLKHLIDQLLTLARAEGGQIPLRHDRVELGELTASVVEQMEPLAHARDIDLGVSVSGAVTMEQSDAEWLRRLLLNLLDNALKFTPPGGTVVVQLSQQDGIATLQVRDTGAGMTSDTVARVFEPFYRADPARSARVEGAGLGLSLVKWIVDRHRGRIDIESQPGRGSTFTVRLPLVH